MNEAQTNNKADQIALHFYTKLVHVVNDARTTVGAEPRATQSKVDKWFNLETLDSDIFTRELRDRYRSVSSSHPRQPPPPLEIQVLLCIPEPNANQVLVHTPFSPSASPTSGGGGGPGGGGPQQRIHPVPSHVVLETWALDFIPRDNNTSSSSSAASTSSGMGTSQSQDIAPATIYKNGIQLFRSVYSLLRLLPSWSLCKRTAARRGMGGAGVGGAMGMRNGGMGIQIRVRDLVASTDGSRILEFGARPAPDAHSPFPTNTHSFSPIAHPTGALHFSCTYLTTPRFDLVDRETYYSSNLLNEPDFVPTLTKNQQRESGTFSTSSAATGAAGAAPIGSVPRSITGGGLSSLNAFRRAGTSPPSHSDSVADRFVLPRAGSASNTSPRGSPSSRNVPLPSMSRNTPLGLQQQQQQQQLQPSGAGSGSWSSRDRDEHRQQSVGTTSSSISSRMARIRTESGSGSTLATPALPGTSGSPVGGGGTSSSASPIRRPGINPVHPFKSNTLASATQSQSSLGLTVATASSGGTSSGVGSASKGSPLSNPPSGLSSTATAPTTSSNLRNSIGSAAEVPGVGGVGSVGEKKFPIMKQSPGDTSSPSPAVTGGGGVSVPSRKRYSSSFGHRFSNSNQSNTMNASPKGGAGGSSEGGGGGSVDSPASGPQSSSTGVAGGGGSGGGSGGNSGAPSASASFLETRTEDDDISSFVNDIDSRVPLRRDRRTNSGTNIPSPLSSSPPTGPGLRGPAVSNLAQQRMLMQQQPQQQQGPSSAGGSLGGSPATAMLTSEGEVDEKLRKMKEDFLASLEGLGSGAAGGGGGTSSNRGGSRLSGGASRPRPPLTPTSNRASLQGSEEYVGRLEFGSGHGGKDSPSSR